MRLTTAAACALILHWFNVLSGATLLFTSAVAPAAAQQVDLNAIQRRYHQSYAAGDYATALAEALKLEAGAKVRFGASDANYASALYNLAIAYDALGRYAQAEQHYKEALAIEEKVFGPGNRKIVRIINNLAIVNMH